MITVLTKSRNDNDDSADIKTTWWTHQVVYTSGPDGIGNSDA